MTTVNPNRTAADALPDHPNMTTMTSMIRSTQMYTIHEALARERMRERERQARAAHLAAELAAERRWRYLAERARRAAERHGERALQASVAAPAR